MHTGEALAAVTDPADKVWFITGASRGFGRALVMEALVSGARVAATARRPGALDDIAVGSASRLCPLELDVTREDEVPRAVHDAIDAFGHIDVVVNNAGFGLEGAVEEPSDDQLRAQIETNVFGPLWVTRAVLPHLRERRTGHIVQMSSVGGRVAFPTLGLYHASKWALEGFSEALAAEIAPFGIKVTIVEPGAFRTDWAGSSMVRAKPMAAYVPTLAHARAARAAHSGHQSGDPAKAARAIVEITSNPRPPLRLVLGNDSVRAIRAAEASRLAEMATWEPLSRSTDYDVLNGPNTVLA